MPPSAHFKLGHDISGQRFGSRVVLSVATPVGSKSKKWNYICDCGRKGTSEYGNIVRSVSCSKECPYSPLRIHGMRKHPAYRSWDAMWQRCTNPRSNTYHMYGARGITVCKTWRSFAVFWDDMGPTWEKGLSIDRVDTTKSYSKNNCRWATAKEQANNTRRNKWFDTPHGRITMTQAAEIYGISKGCIQGRIARGCPAEKLFLKPNSNKHV